MLQKPEGFRAVKVEIVVSYIDPLTTQDLESSGFPEG
jgi:hypothetical protein